MCSNILTFKLKSFLSAWKNYWLVIFWLPKMLFFSLYKLNVRCRYKIWKLFITIAKSTFSLIEGISLLMYLCQIQKNYFIDKILIGMFCHFAYLWSVQFSSSVVSDSLRPHGLQHARPPYPSPTPGVYSNSCPLSRWCHPTTSSSVIPLSSFNLSQYQGLFKWSVLCIKWPKYWSFSFSISPSNEYSGLISFRIDWFVLLAVQGTLKSLLQHHSSKAWILQHSAFFIVQLSHPYMTTEKNTALTTWTFVSKLMSLLFNICLVLLLLYFQGVSIFLFCFVFKFQLEL